MSAARTTTDRPEGNTDRSTGNTDRLEGNTDRLEGNTDPRHEASPAATCRDSAPNRPRWGGQAPAAALWRSRTLS